MEITNRNSFCGKIEEKNQNVKDLTLFLIQENERLLR